PGSSPLPTTRPHRSRARRRDGGPDPRPRRDLRRGTPFTGGVYRASGWIRVGTTQGRGRCGTDERYGKPNTDVWLRPLAQHWRRILHR
ncbi:MAG: DUF4338 domain-containing protein, partial [Gammaproteobacteria bacterium]|nr:DUF4338 domain-containing protein [Gammaproteobacteria bacterium]